MKNGPNLLSFFFILSLLLFSCHNKAEKELADLKIKYQELSSEKKELEKLLNTLQNTDDSLSEYASILLLSYDCNTDECILSDAPGHYFGTMHIRGYYVDYKKNMLNDGEEPYSVQCDGLVITDGPEMVINMYRKLLEEGNSVNHFDENNNLVLNIDLENCTAEEQEKIKNSSSSSPADLNIFIVYEDGKCADPCESFFKILKAE